MTVRKLNTGQWICDIRPNGVDGKRIRKKFVTRGEAIAYENFVIAETQNKPWLGDKEDPRRLNDLIQLWFNSHGSTLGDGETRLSAMYYISECLGNPKAVNFTAKDFASYREKRLSGELYRTERIKKVAPRSLNLELAYLNAMFNELIRLGEWTLTNPVKNIRAFRLDESEMAFLEQDQITTLLNECKNSTNPDTLIVALICISTGARWSEAEKLTNSAISQFRITYTKTKGKRNRTVPISKELYNILPKKKGRLFGNCYSAFLSALKRSQIELPPRQKSHVLRHTFASHFMMNGGNILVLQKILGHTDIKMTMRYAHFSPNHLEEAINLNPIKDLSVSILCPKKKEIPIKHQ